MTADFVVMRTAFWTVIAKPTRKLKADLMELIEFSYSTALL